MAGEEPTLGDLIDQAVAEPGPGPAPPAAGGRPALSWRAPTGAGELGAYRDHPLNLRPGSDWGARIARGLEGITGGARLAVVDIGMGLLGYLRGNFGRPSGPPPAPPPAAGGPPGVG